VCVISIGAFLEPFGCEVNALHKLGFLPVALAATAGFSLVLAPNAFGQQQTAEVERVIVTGSNIPSAEEVGSNPVLSINRDLINKSGAGTTTEQLLQRQPVMNGATIPVQNNAQSGAGPAGTAALALRGLDPGATLVLIDHRRVAPFPGAANSAYGFVDLTTIPITPVQSIDILKDGASTTYGSDAIAGVVNFNFYKDYRGAQTTIQYGDTLDKDAVEYRGISCSERATTRPVLLVTFSIISIMTCSTMTGETRLSRRS